ncbi:MAG TPA: dTDP-4-dehydrorhamnose 3,5-epimerase family protein, partial [Pyrinomonadaceae bacterium]
LVMGEESADVLYKTTAEYTPETEGGIIWNDPELAIEWPLNNPWLSARDLELPNFSNYSATPPAWSE